MTNHLARAIASIKPLPAPYVPHEPTPKQWAFLALDCREALFGGAAGGGKSDTLLMAALQYVDVPGYAAIIFRRTYQDLSRAGALIPRSHEWLHKSPAKWNERTKTWLFPSGASLGFGYLDTANDRYNYQSSEYQFIAFDELTQFEERDYEYLFSRLRRLADMPVPIRMRGASNPGGIGHEWVNRRFVNPKTKESDSVFIPSKLEDNPHLDRDDYEKSLEKLDITTRRQLRHGDWNVQPDGGILFREWWQPWKKALPDLERLVLSIDGALNTNETPKGRASRNAATLWGMFRPYPETAPLVLSPMLLAGWAENCGYVKLRQMINAFHEEDDIDETVIENKASGPALADDLRHMGLKGVTLFDPKRLDKQGRALRVQPLFESGAVWYDPNGVGVRMVIDECTSFPDGSHDDLLDTVTQMLLKMRARRNPWTPDEVDEDAGRPRRTLERPIYA